MAYTPITDEQIQVGKPTKKELFEALRDSVDDHEDRIDALETSSSVIPIWNEDVWNAGAMTSLTNLLTFQALQPIRVVKVLLQIYTKGGIASGILELDVLKASTLDPSFFATILSDTAKINFASASDYGSDEATIDATQNQLTTGDFLRVDIPTMPATPVGKFRIVVYGEAV